MTLDLWTPPERSTRAPEDEAVILRVCLCRAGDPASPLEVELDAPDGAVWTDVVGAAGAWVGLTGPIRAWVERAPADPRPGGRESLPGRARLGVPPLVHGVVVTLAPTRAAGPAVPRAAGPAPPEHGTGAGTWRGPDPAVTAATGASASSAGLVVHVVAGPDAGQILGLGAGGMTVGRGHGCELVVADARLSRRHLRVVAANGTGPHVFELGSTNGSALAGRAVGPAPVSWPVGAPVRVGDTVLRLRRASMPQDVTATGDGTLALNPAPLIGSGPTPLTVRLPDPPGPPRTARFPFLLTLLPLLASVVIAVALDNPLFLLIGLLSPALTLGHVLGDRRERRRDAAEAEAEWRHGREQAAAALERRAVQEQAALEAAHPDPAALAVLAFSRLPPLWAHAPSRPGALTVRLGIAEIESPWTTLIHADGQVRPWVPEAPLVLDLDEAPVVGIVGPRVAALGLARAITTQLAVRCSPRHLRVFVLTSGPARAQPWRWCAWLPHAQGAPAPVRRPRDAGAFLAELRRPGAVCGDEAAGRTLLILDGSPQLRAVGDLATLLADASRTGLRALCLADEVGGLPSECATVIDVAAAPDRPAVAGAGTPRARHVRFDGVGIGWAEAVARALAPLRDPAVRTGRGQPGLPEEVDLLDLLDAADNPADLAARWRRHPHGVRVPVGAGIDGPHVLDLDADGPHVLVGGMTGSGKSELLRTLVIALAVANRPDELGVVLIDYKGGSAFGECTRLPHTLGLVTDLDAAEAERALHSLRGELRRREWALRDAGVRDHAGYRRARTADGTLPPLPRLVIVVDEFRALAEDRPDFVSGLVRIASLGRGLGVHLVLATQRPAGAVSAEIRANCGLRIALRVRDRVDSQDVIDADDAALLAAGCPGRAYFRVGGGDLRVAQVARILPRRVPAGLGPVRLLPFEPWADRADPAQPGVRAPAVRSDPGQSGQSGQETRLGDVVETLAAAAAHLHLTPVSPPWLPPLPPRVTARDLTAHAVDPARLGSGARDVTAAVYGLADDPEAARRVPASWAPEEGNLAIVGAARSGRSTTLRTIAAALAVARPAGDVHLYVLHGGPEIPGVAGLPHVGAVVGADEPARVRRFLVRLQQEARDRQHDTGSPPPASIVVLVDDWSRLHDALAALDRGESIERLLQLLRNGRSAFVSWVVTGDDVLLRASLVSCFTDALLLGRSDPAGLAGLGWARDRSVPDLPGRARRRCDGRELQIAVLEPAAIPVDPRPGEASANGSSARPDVGPGGHADPATTVRPTVVTEPGACRPWGVPALPTDLCLADLQDTALPPTGRQDADHHDPDRPYPDRHRTGQGGSVPTGARRLTPIVGMSAADAGPACWDVTEGALVCGPRGSGRSTTLATLGATLARHDTAHVLVHPDPSCVPAQVAGRLGVCGPRDATALRRLTRSGPSVVLVDDLDRLAGTDVEGEIEALAGPGPDGIPIIAAMTASDALTHYRGAVAALRRAGTGIVLWPQASDGEIFGVALPTGEARVPGRGVLVHRGQAVEIQMARPLP